MVFQLDWYDVNEIAGDEGGSDQRCPPYQGNAQAKAKDAFRVLGGDPAELPGLIWCNPVRTLFAFLADPDPVRWQHAATAAVAGLLAHPGRELTGLNPSNFPERVVASLTGQPLPSGGGGDMQLNRVTDASGCPVTVILDPRDRDAHAPIGHWTALAMIDDRPDAVAAGDGDRSHQRRWAAWLYWGNLVKSCTIRFRGNISARMAP